MPARDRYHQELRNALVRDGWTITDDPLRLEWGKKDLYVDLGAEQLFAAQKGTRKIAVELKSFTGPSEITDLERAVGQFVIYLDVMERVEPERELFLAINNEIFEELFEEPIGTLLLENRRLRLIVFDPLKEEILRWKPETPSAT